MITLGQKVKDLVSGFTGVAYGRSTFLNGCNRIGVQPQIREDGTLPQDQWFDEPQLVVVDEKPVLPPGNRKKGGPMPGIPTRHKPK